MDDLLRQSERRASEGLGDHIESIKAKARTGDEDAQRAMRDIEDALRHPMSVLRDLNVWDRSHHELQDQAIRAVASRLGDNYEHKETLVFSCEMQYGSIGPFTRHPEPIPTSETISHRIAVFEHKSTGIEFSLCPGLGADNQPPDFVGDRMVDPPDIPPLLAARTPVTWRQTTFLERQMSSVGDIDCPVNRVGLPTATSWARLYDFDLPDFDSWRHFMLAGATTRFYFGEEMNDNHVWHQENSPHEVDVRGWGTRRYGWRPSPVTEHLNAGSWNAFGLIDVIGNVNEWLLTMHPGHQRDYVIGGSYAMLRGAAPSMVMPSPRPPGSRLNEDGFRVVKRIP